MDLDWLWEGSASGCLKRPPRTPRTPRPPRSPPKSRCQSREGRVPKSPCSNRFTRKPSRKTLAEAIAAGSQVLSWRGDTFRSIELANEASRELGHHYRDCVLAKAAHDRLRAAKWAKRIQQQSLQNAMGPRTSFTVRKSVTEPVPSLPDPGDSLPVEKKFSLQAASQRATMARRLSLLRGEDRLDSKETERRKSVQIHSMERRKSQQPTKMMKYNRLQRLMAAKQAEFDALPLHQQERLRLAFNHAKEDLQGFSLSYLVLVSDGFNTKFLCCCSAPCVVHNGPQWSTICFCVFEDKPLLNAMQLRQALTEIKLTGRMNHEKEVPGNTFAWLGGKPHRSWKPWHNSEYSWHSSHSAAIWFWHVLTLWMLEAWVLFGH